MSLANPTRTIAGAFASAADARAALVSALARAGLHAASVAPDAPTAGAAWPQWQQTTWDGHLCDPARYSFAVFVVLGAGNFETAVAEGDAIVAAVAPYLYPLAAIELAEPVQITFGEGTTMPGIRFRVTTRA